jgi:hypothetical protein
MSIPVPLADLETTLADHPWGYLVTVTDEPRGHTLAVPTRYVDGILLAKAGRGTLANIALRPKATMVFPPSAPGGHSLIVDGEATVVGDEVAFTPTTAILHRPAISDT